MTDLSIPDELAEQLQDIARRENRSVTDVLQSFVSQYNPPPSQTEQQAAVRSFQLKMYERARRYWEKVGNKERLALTDEDLDEQFWLFDKDDIPRLKSDEGSFELLPNPFAGLIGMFDSETEAADLSTSVRETLDKYAHPQYGWTRRGRTD